MTAHATTQGSSRNQRQNFKTLTNAWVQHVHINRPSSEAEYEQLIALLDHITDLMDDPDHSPYTSLFDLVAGYCEDWENEHEVALEMGDPRDLLTAMMDAHGVTQAMLVKADITDQPNLSKIIKHGRGISKAVAKRLGDYFKVSADTFL